MVKTIVKDPLFLAQKSANATEADKQVVTELLDTLRANLEHCVGMAAILIKNTVSGMPHKYSILENLKLDFSIILGK